MTDFNKMKKMLEKAKIAFEVSDYTFKQPDGYEMREGIRESDGATVEVPITLYVDVYRQQIDINGGSATISFDLKGNLISIEGIEYY